MRAHARAKVGDIFRARGKIHTHDGYESWESKQCSIDIAHLLIALLVH